MKYKISDILVRIRIFTQESATLILNKILNKPTSDTEGEDGLGKLLVGPKKIKLIQLS